MQYCINMKEYVCILTPNRYTFGDSLIVYSSEIIKLPIFFTVSEKVRFANVFQEDINLIYLTTLKDQSYLITVIVL